MSTVVGTVVVSETQLAIPGLLVSLFDVGDGGPTGSIRNLAILDEARVRRLGSKITDLSGRFAIEFDGDPAPAGTATPPVAVSAPAPRPSLLLVVTAPEDNGESGPGAPLFFSRSVRRNAGRTESFAIRIPTNRLKKAGLVPPAEPSDPAPALEAVGLHEARARVIHAGLREVAAARVEAERTRLVASGDDFERELVQSISRTPRALVRPTRRINQPAEIAEKNRSAISDGVSARFSGPDALTFTTRFHLTPAQVERLQALIGGTNRPLTGEEMKQLLLNRQGPAPEAPALVSREQPLLDEFLQQTHREQCAEAHLGLATTSGGGTPATPSPNSNGNGRPVGQDDITSLAATLLRPVTPPEAGVTFGVVNPNGRPGTGEVQNAIDAFTMRPGPADQPALFDFHRLQIAFDHVWQEILDDDVIDLAREVNRQVRAAGGNPRHASHAGKGPLRALRDEALLVESCGANRISSPPAVVTLPRATYLRQNPALDIGVGFGPGEGVLDPLPPRPPRDPDPEPPDPPDGKGGSVVAPTGPSTPPPGPLDLMKQLEAMLAEPYSFTIYGADPGTRSVNFGIIVTYRQRWEPTAYQAGELIKTIPLAPGETRKVSYKQVIKRKRAEKELERWSSLRKEEMSQTSRTESDIVRKALAKTNFSLTTEGTYNIGLAKGDSSTQIGRDASQEVQDTKRAFQEAVSKAAQEYKQERSLEITTETSTEVERVESTDISNENKELTVTYMFYELQRRYRVSEELYRITPVVMVAQEVPNPAQITEGFLLAHDWILKQALLDQDHLPALEYLAKHVEGDRLALHELRINVNNQRKICYELNEELLSMREQSNRRYEALVRAVETRAKEIQAENNDGFFSDLGQSLGIGDGQSPEAARVREDAARDAEQRAVEQVKDLTTRLQREVTALNEITEKYTKQLREARNRQVQILRLRLHVKMYILHYMQAIWAFESHDQRFLRLHQVKVPTFADAGTEYAFTGKVEGSRLFGRRDGKLLRGDAHEFQVRSRIALSPGELPLEEIADLSEPLGFHGNYIIFPLKRPNALTDVLTAPYVDSGWELMDPSAPSHLNRAEFAAYVCFLHDRLTPAEFNALREELKAMYRELLLSPSLQGHEIVVPTDSLFIEALPGAHPLLEDFKLAHRAIDVKRAQAEVRGNEIENLRRVYRLLKEQLDDPDIDKIISVENGARVGLLTDGNA